MTVGSGTQLEAIAGNVKIKGVQNSTTKLSFCTIITRIKNIKNATRCRDSRSAKSIETR